VQEIAEEGGAFAEVKVDLGGTAILARITHDSVQRLELTPGKPVYALVKSIAIDGHTVSAAPLDLG
jgi:molybdate transport system ATP-binding protein